MCQFLTRRLTKNVSWSILLGLFLSVSVPAQEDLVGRSDPNIRAEPAAESQEPLDDDAVQVDDSGPGRLEEIDESSVAYQDEGTELKDEVVETATPLSEEVEDLKKAALELNRDLLILEEELLFPANSQIVIFLSLDVGRYFSLDSVKVLIDDQMVASHLYTKRQNTALALGGIQRLYLGNLKSGDHEITAFFVGVGPENREYKRGATVVINKDDDPKLLELKVRDSTANMQPEFEFEEWQL